MEWSIQINGGIALILTLCVWTAPADRSESALTTLRRVHRWDLGAPVRPERLWIGWLALDDRYMASDQLPKRLDIVLLKQTIFG